MSTGKLLSALVLMAAVILVTRTAFSGPNLGREVKPEEIAAWDISIPPECEKQGSESNSRAPFPSAAGA